VVAVVDKEMVVEEEEGEVVVVVAEVAVEGEVVVEVAVEEVVVEGEVEEVVVEVVVEEGAMELQKNNQHHYNEQDVYKKHHTHHSIFAKAYEEYNFSYHPYYPTSHKSLIHH